MPCASAALRSFKKSVWADWCQGLALSNYEIFLCGLIRKCLGRNLLMGVVITNSFDNVIISCSLLSNRNLEWGSFLLLMSACPPTQLQTLRECVDTRPGVCLLDHNMIQQANTGLLSMMIRWREVNYLLRHVIYWPCHQIMLGSPVKHTTYENFYDAVDKTAKTFKVLLKVTFTPL